MIIHQVSGVSLVNSGGLVLDIMKKLLLMILFVSTASQATDITTEDNTKKTSNSSNTQILPDINLDEYKDELIEYQRLQRKNLMLKLISENRELEKNIGNSHLKNGDISLVSIISLPNGGLSANIYDGYIRKVKSGDIVDEKYKVTKINRNNIEVLDLKTDVTKVIMLARTG